MASARGKASVEWSSRLEQDDIHCDEHVLIDAKRLVGWDKEHVDVQPRAGVKAYANDVPRFQVPRSNRELTLSTSGKVRLNS